METAVVGSGSPEAYVLALAVLQSGGLVAFPTDTVYGLGAMAFRPEAVEALFVAKGRPEKRAIPVLLSHSKDLEKVASDVSASVARLAAVFWPGPLTIIVPKRADIPSIVSSSQTVAVRVPDHDVARKLIRLSGPLAVTSANLSGQPAAQTAEEALRQLGGRIEMILDGGRSPGGLASTIVDCSGVGAPVLRAGPVTTEQIQAALAASRDGPN
jgi:L-threonylcarbamoyladenylate synthase